MLAQDSYLSGFLQRLIQRNKLWVAELGHNVPLNLRIHGPDGVKIQF